MFKPVPSSANFPALEAEVLTFWRERKVFARTQERRPGQPEFVFYEGPPTANGLPAIHHVLARSFKDLFPRYKVMAGYFVTRKGGWDTHGLPVEISVEKKLGWQGRNHGASREELEEFNRLCRQSVFETIQEWNAFTERLGYWVDLGRPYITYQNSYIESVWNLLQRLWNKGLVEQDYKVVPLSPRISTTLSKAELGEEDSYREVDDPSVYVRFPLKLESMPQRVAREFIDSQVGFTGMGSLALVVWTTTPWTLPSNTMAAVHPDLTYVLAESPMGQIIVAEEAVDRLSALNPGAEPLSVLARFPGRDLEWWEYEPPFPEVISELGVAEQGARRTEENGEESERPLAHFIALADFVSAADGSGVAHEAPVYGAEDLALARRYGTPLVFGVDDHGILQVTSERGQFFKDADKGLIRDLKARGLMYWSGTLRHRYPFHDRTGDPILYYAKPSWYVRTQQNAQKLVETNEAINWVPENVKHGRFGKWLEGNVDWAISRERYWGTPLPFWRSEDGEHTICVGSVQELSVLAGRVLTELDLHRPYIDDVVFEKDGQTYRRVPEVLDVWFDSGSMPYAQWHLLINTNMYADEAKAVVTANAIAQHNPISKTEAVALNRQGKLEQSHFNIETLKAAYFPDGYPFRDAESIESGRLFKDHFPADFICEAVDQTRGWFYSLHAISTLLYDQPAYRNVICLGHIVDEAGKKMSKSKGNVVAPIPMFDKYGADSVRWYMFTASEPGDQKRFSERLVEGAQRSFVNTLWSVYSFFTLYANLDQPDLKAAPAESDRPEIDRWLLARLEETTAEVTAGLDAYDARGGARALERFTDDLSNWYVRRNRRRFWRGGEGEGGDSLAAYATLHTALVTTATLAAPFTPFLAEDLYQNLVRGLQPDAPESVHLTAWPAPNPARANPTLTAEMNAVLQVVELGRAVRGAHNLKTRQPLPKVMLRAPGAAQTASLGRFAEQIKEELNVKQVELLDQYASVVSYSLRPNLPLLGKKFGKSVPLVRQALQDGDTAAVARAVRDGQPFTVTAGGEQFELGPDEVLVDAKSPEGLAAAEQNGFLLAFDTQLSRELVLEGLARDLVRGVQDARKKAGFEVQDRIRLSLDLSGDAREAAEAWQQFIADETLADLHFGMGDGFSTELEGGVASLVKLS